MPAFIDMSGERYGRWLVLTFSRRDENSGAMWLCRCDCGIEREVARKSLIRGASVSCGCIRSPDLTGRRFGRLVARERIVSADSIVRWQCACDCGAETEVTFANLLRGTTTSCGCWHREAARGRRLSHGHTDGGHSPTYMSWKAAVYRCENESFPQWRDYGGRGIVMCERWRRDFTAFLHDMGERPTGLTLDRIDNDKGYEPGNCRWATRSEQRQNQRPAKQKGPRHDLLHRRFGRLSVTGFAGMKDNRAQWRCLCDCRTEKVIAAKSLLRGDTRSCGCLRRSKREPKVE